MSVYVDDMKADFQPTHRPGRKYVMSHMIADTEVELHAMANKIGVLRKWYQGDHYDITQTKKALAIKAGAHAISLRELACMSALRRLYGLPLGNPSTAQMRLYQARNGKFSGCKNRQANVMNDGSCIECGVDQGEACRGDQP